LYDKLLLDWVCFISKFTMWMLQGSIACFDMFQPNLKQYTVYKTVFVYRVVCYNSPVILWFDPKLIATQTIFTVSSTKKCANNWTYQKFWEFPVGESDLLCDLFSKIQEFLMLFPPCIILTIQIWCQMIGLTVRNKVTLIWCP